MSHEALTSVLLVEDNFVVASSFHAALTSRGWSVIGPIADRAAAEDAIAESLPTCAVLDVNVRGGSTLDLARRLVVSGTPVILVTGYGQLPGEQDENDPVKGATRLTKPAFPDEVVEAVERAISKIPPTGGNA